MSAIGQRHKGGNILQPDRFKSENAYAASQKEQVYRGENRSGNRRLHPLDQSTQGNTESRAKQRHQRQREQRCEPVDAYWLRPPQDIAQSKHEQSQHEGDHKSG